jgi:hypothetical protein
LLRVTRNESGVELLIECHKDAEDGQKLAFKHRVVELPTIIDEYGLPCTSLVLNPINELDTEVKAPILSDASKKP